LNPVSPDFDVFDLHGKRIARSQDLSATLKGLAPGVYLVKDHKNAKLVYVK
jgi:hypothetical protein